MRVPKQRAFKKKIQVLTDSSSWAYIGLYGNAEILCQTPQHKAQQGRGSILAFHSVDWVKCSRCCSSWRSWLALEGLESQVVETQSQKLYIFCFRSPLTQRHTLARLGPRASRPLWKKEQKLNSLLKCRSCWAELWHRVLDPNGNPVPIRSTAGAQLLEPLQAPQAHSAPSAHCSPFPHHFNVQQYSANCKYSDFGI